MPQKDIVHSHSLQKTQDNYNIYWCQARYFLLLPEWNLSPRTNRQANRASRVTSRRTNSKTSSRVLLPRTSIPPFLKPTWDTQRHSNCWKHAVCHSLCTFTDLHSVRGWCCVTWNFRNIFLLQSSSLIVRHLEQEKIMLVLRKTEECSSHLLSILASPLLLLWYTGNWNLMVLLTNAIVNAAGSLYSYL